MSRLKQIIFTAVSISLLGTSICSARSSKDILLNHSESLAYVLGGFDIKAKKALTIIESNSTFIRFNLGTLAPVSYMLEKKSTNFYVLTENQSKQSIKLFDSDFKEIDKMILSDEVTSSKIDPTKYLIEVDNKKIPDGYILSSNVYQCLSDIPEAVGILKHTWLEVKNQTSYGMPFTDEHTYMGGRAHIFNPDPMIYKDADGKQCVPLLHKKSDSDLNFATKLSCVSDALSIPGDVSNDGLSKKTWVAHLDYNALDHNCLTAVRFMTECSDGKFLLEPNLGVGKNLNWSQLYSVTVLPKNFDRIHSLYLEFKKSLSSAQNITVFQPLDQIIKTKLFELDLRLLSNEQRQSANQLKNLAENKNALQTFQYFTKWIRSILVYNDLEVEKKATLKEMCERARTDCGI